MTITLHWWMFPAALVLCAIAWLVVGWNRSGFLGGLAEAMIAFVLVMCAVMFTAGHLV